MCLAAGSALNFRPQLGHSTRSSSSGREGGGGAPVSMAFCWLMAFLNLLLSIFHFGIAFAGFFYGCSSFLSSSASSSTTFAWKTFRLTSFPHSRTCFSSARSLNLFPQPSGHSTSTTSSNSGGSSLSSLAALGTTASFAICALDFVGCSRRSCRTAGGALISALALGCYCAAFYIFWAGFEGFASQMWSSCGMLQPFDPLSGLQSLAGVAIGWGLTVRTVSCTFSRGCSRLGRGGGARASFFGSGCSLPARTRQSRWRSLQVLISCCLTCSTNFRQSVYIQIMAR